MIQIQIEVSESMMACYGAVVATIVAIIQIANFLRDKKRIKIKIDKNIRIVGAHGSYPYKEDTDYVAIRIINLGRREVTIFAAGIFLLNGEHLVPTDILKGSRITLTEGKRHDVFIEQKKLDFSKIAYFYAVDYTETTYKKNIANPLRRLYWTIKRKF